MSSSSPLSPEDHAAAVAGLDMFSKGGQVWKRKKKKKTFSNWKQRYFHLKGGRIYYYASVSDVKSLGDFDLVVTQVTQVKPDKHSSHKHVFKLATFNSEYHIATETEEELLQWMNMINRVKDHIFTNGLNLQLESPSKKPKPKRGLSSMLSRKKSSSSSAIFSMKSSKGITNNNDASDSKKGREAVVQEILKTEQDYVADLKVVTDHYIFKLTDYGLMQNHQKDAVFGNIEDLVPIHIELLKKLEEAIKQPEPKLGEIFAEVAPQFTVYSNYCAAQASAKETISMFSDENPNFGLCIEELSTHEDAKGLDLASYLIKPMQRICKYPLLIRELLKETNETDSDYTQLQSAYDNLQQYLTVVNENKRTFDNLMDLIAIQDSIIDKQLSLQAKGRCLVKKQEFRKIYFGSAATSPMKGTLWLLSDMLIFGKKKEKDKYFFKEMVSTDSVLVWDLDPNGTAPPDKKNGFSVVSTDKEASCDKIIILASTPVEKLDWINLINSSIGSLV